VSWVAVSWVAVWRTRGLTAWGRMRATKARWAWLRIGGGVAVLAILGWQLGAGPVLHGMRAVTTPALLASMAIGLLTTVSCAWRWRVVAAGLGVRLPLGGAVAAYYRAQFLNATLPGGVLGDAHRAVRHGVDIGDVRLGVRAVVLERLAAQPVHAIVAVVVLWACPSPVPRYVPAIGAALIAATALAAVVGTLRPPRRPRVVRSGLADVRLGLLTVRVLAPAMAASFVVLAGHLAMFLLAARITGATAPLSRLLPLTLLALIAMGLPINIAGWGPREGVAAWAFAAAGLTAAQGVSAAVTYGVLTLAATLPGAVILLVGSPNRRGARGRDD
jgi:glycosyltransferase 2 family protein